MPSFRQPAKLGGKTKTKTKPAKNTAVVPASQNISSTNTTTFLGNYTVLQTNYTLNQTLNQTNQMQIGYNISDEYFIQNFSFDKNSSQQIQSPQISEDMIKQVSKPLSSLFSLPISQIKGLKYFGFLVDDLILYLYDQREYYGIAKLVMTSIDQIERQKFALTKKMLNIDNFNQSLLPISNYSEFSYAKHLEVDGNTNNLLENLFNFFIFNIPETFLIALLFYICFRLLSDYSYSIYIRRFYFIGAVILQSFFQTNICYFVYIGLLQTQSIFYFQYFDMIVNGFGIVFFGLVFIFSWSFYLVYNSLIQKQFGYFIYYYYRTFPALIFITLKITLRGLINGFIHFFLRNHYLYLMITLSSFEGLIIIMCLIVQIYHQIFIAKTFFVLTLIFHFLIILLNVALYFEEQSRQKSKESAALFIDFQGIIIILYILTIIFLIIADLIPLKLLKNTHESTQNESIQNNLTQNSSKEASKKLQLQKLDIEGINFLKISNVQLKKQEYIRSLMDQTLLNSSNSNIKEGNEQIQENRAQTKKSFIKCTKFNSEWKIRNTIHWQQF